jgi:hypothetical protein
MEATVAELERMRNAIGTAGEVTQKVFDGLLGILTQDGLGINNKEYTDFTEALSGTEQAQTAGGWENLNDEELSAALLSLGINLEALGISVVDFRANLIAAGNSLEDMQNNFANRLNGGSINDYNQLSKISTAGLNGLFESLREVYLHEGAEGMATQMEAIDSILATMNPDEAERFMSALNSVDWTNMESGKDFVTTIEELGFSDTVINAAEELAASMLEASDAAYDFSLSARQERFANLEDLRKELESKIENGENKFTQEEVDKYLELDPSLADKFLASGSGYTYAGDMTELSGVIDAQWAATVDNTAAI